MNGLFFGGMCKYPDLDDSYCKGVVSEARLRLHNVFKAIGVDVRSLLCLLNFEFTFSHFIWGVLWHKAPSRPIQRGGPVPESVQRPGLSNDAHQNHHTCRKLPPLQLCKHFFFNSMGGFCSWGPDIWGPIHSLWAGRGKSTGHYLSQFSTNFHKTKW